MVMKVLVVLALLACVACAPSGGGALSADATSFQHGMARQRAVDIFQNPRACAIVLLRARCVRDTHVIFGYVGENEIPSWWKRLLFASTGDMADFPEQLGDLNTTGLTSLKQWKSLPRQTWFEGAGIAYVLALGETDDVMHQLEERRLLGELNEHGADAGAQEVLGKSGSQADVVAALRKAFPISADPQVIASDDPAGDYRRGAYISTFNALGQVPAVLLEPQSRAFVVALVEADLATGATAPGWTGAALKNAIATQTSARDMLAWFEAVSALNTAANTRLGKAAHARVLVGIYAAQGAQNAGVWREKRFDREVRSYLTGPATTALPRAAEAARRAYLAAKPDDWRAKNRSLSALVLALLP